MDKDLVARVRAGDFSAYRELVEKYKNTVYGLAISHVRDFDLAEDLAQEAFIRGFYRLDSLKDPNRFKSWLTSAGACTGQTYQERQGLDSPLLS